MLRTTIDKAYLKRTIRPLYGWTQATPNSKWLDPNWDRSVDIYPGFGMVRAGGDLVTLPNGAGDKPIGLAGLYVGGDGIDEVEEQGINAFPVWVLGPDAEFEILAPAFDTEETWTDPTDGTSLMIHVSYSGDARGKLVPSTASNKTTAPVAKLVSVVSDTKIVIAGLGGTV